jgi:hypothetical protein
MARKDEREKEDLSPQEPPQDEYKRHPGMVSPDEKREMSGWVKEYAEKNTINEKDFDSRTFADIRTVKDYLNLMETKDAIFFSVRLSAFLIQEIKRGSTIVVHHKSGMRSKMIIERT